MPRGRVWLAARTAGERRLLTVVGVLTIVLLVWTIGRMVQTDLGRLRQRVARADRELASARMLAGRLAAAGEPSAPLAPLVATVEAAATAVIGVERLASLDPDALPDGGEQASIGLVDVTLADVIGVLQRLEIAGDRARELDLRRHADDRSRYDATIVVERRGPA